MSDIISTSSDVINSLATDFSSTVSALESSENSRNSQASKLKKTSGFAFIDKISSVSVRANSTTNRAATLTLREMGRIKEIHEAIRISQYEGG